MIAIIDFQLQIRTKATQTFNLGAHVFELLSRFAGGRPRRPQDRDLQPAAEGQVGQTTDREQGADNWLAEEESGGAGGAGEG